MECEKQESEADTKTFEFTLINQSINQLCVLIMAIILHSSLPSKRIHKK